MNLGIIAFEYVIGFWEMLTSCLLATIICQKEVKGKKSVTVFVLFAACGSALMYFRQNGMIPMSDWVPEIIIFVTYAFVICHAKIWSAVLWALLNYLMIGVVSLSLSSVMSLVTGTPMEKLHQTGTQHLILCVMVRLGQMLVVEIIHRIMLRIKKPFIARQKDMGLIGILLLSIIALMLLWNGGTYLTEDTIPYVTISICLLVMILNLTLLFLKEILSKEKYQNKELQDQNRLITMQIRNQNEISEMYHSMRALKHDMNNHLHTIAGYMQAKNYEEAEMYIQKMAGDIKVIEAYQCGHPVVDALIGSKSTLAKKNDIRLDIDISVPSELQITADHLSIVLGNLYDNAIDANLKIADKSMRYITIQILLKGNDLLLCFENAAIGEDRSDKFHWTTSKKTVFEHGFGLKNIDRIVRMYDGYCFRELKNNVFVCRIRIPNEKLLTEERRSR
ncbi:MAG: GHKL domain-containing protein [Lachnospiraceae bacterium]|nr:GHKL domain-containing protein [Lachnospiraceae bacterium]